MMFWAVAVQASTPTNHTCAANPRWSVRLAWIAAELEQARVAFEASLARGARLEVQAQRAVIESEQWILDGDVSLHGGDLTLTSARVLVQGAPETSLALQIVWEHARLQVDDVSLALHADAIAWRDGTLDLSRVRLLDASGAWLASADRVQLDETGALSFTGLEVAACPCGDGGSDLVVSATSVTRLDDGVALDGRQLSLWGLPLNIPVDGVHDDGRTSGLLFPRVWFGSEVGVEAVLPVFIRLGRHADLTLGAGWATAIGPVVTARYRHAFGVGSAGDLR